MTTFSIQQKTKQDRAPDEPATPLLSLRGITKLYPGVVANDSVDLDIYPREIHSLLGENGAGKSTLVKMIYEVIQPDNGEMLLHGAHYRPLRPSVARACGISVVFQHFSLFEGLTVADNIALCLGPDMRTLDLDEMIVAVSRSYGLPLEPKWLVGNLSVGERQRVEIVRCLLQKPRLLVMDEPTSVLTPQEVETLFAALRQLSVENCSILYISHKLEEIRSICSKVTVLRGGKVVGTADPRRETAKSLAELMIGAELKPARSTAHEAGPIRLQVSDLRIKSDDKFGVDLCGISFSLHGGEILGIAGVAGNGQDELMRALIGETNANRPEAITLDGVPLGLASPTLRRKCGLCFVPEKRLGHSAAPDMSLWENAVLSARTRMALDRWGFIDVGKSKSFANKVVRDFNVKTAGVSHAAKSHSGGNLQKFVMGREILQQPEVLIVSQPTWGVDAGAAEVIHQAIFDLASAGAAVVVISQDLDELMTISSSFAVIANGRLSPARPTREVTVEEVGVLMGGEGAEAGKEIAHA